MGDSLRILHDKGILEIHHLSMAALLISDQQHMLYVVFFLNVRRSLDYLVFHFSFHILKTYAAAQRKDRIRSH